VINTTHPTYIRVNVFGSSNFDVNSIDPSTVNLSGATPIDNYTLYINGDRNLDRTFIFQGNDPAFQSLPAGFTTVMLNGSTTNFTTFSSQAIVFNVNSGMWTPQRARQITTAVSESAKFIRQFNTIQPAATQASIASVNGGGGISAARMGNSGVTLGSSTVRIPGISANSQNPRVLIQRPAVARAQTQAQGQQVTLGTSTVRIPITNGFGSPVVVKKTATSKVVPVAASKANLNNPQTVRINRTNATGPRVRANIANSINDFVAAY
jgi:hypothetical protein